MVEFQRNNATVEMDDSKWMTRIHTVTRKQMCWLMTQCLGIQLLLPLSCLFIYVRGFAHVNDHRHKFNTFLSRGYVRIQSSGIRSSAIQTASTLWTKRIAQLDRWTIGCVYFRTNKKQRAYDNALEIALSLHLDVCSCRWFRFWPVTSLEHVTFTGSAGQW